MENITKALYMAAGVLIGILVLTAFVWLFTNGGKFLASFEDSGNIKHVELYNADLLVYQKSYDSTEPDSEYDLNTIYDVVTAINKAKDINKQNLFEEINGLQIEVNGIYSLDYKNDETGTSFEQLIPTYGGLIDPTILTDNQKNERRYSYYFTGAIEYDESTGKICKITFDIF